jgi:hypothetical protein
MCRGAAEPSDCYVPLILRSGRIYDTDLDRFFLDLPLNGVRSPPPALIVLNTLS